MLKSNGRGTGIEDELVTFDYGDSGGMGREHKFHYGTIVIRLLSLLLVFW